MWDWLPGEIKCKEGGKYHIHKWKSVVGRASLLGEEKDSGMSLVHHYWFFEYVSTALSLTPCLSFFFFLITVAPMPLESLLISRE